MHKPEPPREAGVYVLGRPLMFVLWGLALWGTFVGAAVVWVGATESAAKALRLCLHPFVCVPILIAVAMWVALFVAVGNYRRRGEP
jgi:cation transporter-like permease